MSDGKLPVADDDVLPIQQEHPQTHPQPQSHGEPPPPPLLTLTQVLPGGLDDDAGLGRKRVREDTGLSGLDTDPTTQHTTAMGTHMTTTDHMVGVGIIDPNDEEARKRRKTIAPPKKLNNEQWDHMFERLVKYKQQHGDCLVPKRYTEDPKLGTWVETQRVQYKRLQAANDSGDFTMTSNRLNQTRLDKLESIGFAWSAKNLRKRPIAVVLPKPKKPGDAISRVLARQRISDSQWNEMYERLIAFKAKYGDCLVPKKYEDDPKLATWVETQRVLYNKDFRNPSSNLPAASGTNPALLAKTDPSPPVPQGGPIAATDVLDRPRGLQPPAVDGSAISAAVAVAKSPDEWANEMDGDGRGSDSGDGTGGINVNGTGMSPTDAPAGNMDHTPMQEVNDVTPLLMVGANDAPTMQETTAHEAEIAAAAELAASTVEIPHHPNPAAEVGLGMEDKTPVKRLTRERKDKLEAIGFVWSLRSKRVDDHWDEMFRQLEQYRAEYGDCLVPSRYEKNNKLGKWVETQRYEYTKLQRASYNLKQEEGGDPNQPPRPVNPRLTDERRRRLESIGFEWKVKHKMKRYYDRQWDNMFEKLLQFKAANGHCLVPKRYPPDAKLGTWVHTQRIQYRKLIQGNSNTNNAAGGEDTAGVSMKEEDVGDDNTPVDEEKPPPAGEEQFFRLTDDRRKRLEEIGFVWSARDSEKANEPNRITRNSYDDQWDGMFERLREYKKKHGNCLVPKRCPEDQKLGTWVDTQRVQYKKMRKKLEKDGIEYVPPSRLEIEARESANRKPVVGRLTDDRIRRLEDLGFIWSLRDDWQKHYDELVEYKRVHGHCNVPARYAKNRRLGIWVSAQRQQYKILNAPVVHESGKSKRSAPLTQERVELLNKLDFTWTIRSRDSLGESWNQKFEELKAYKGQYGNCLVPSRYPHNPELGIWVGTQRTQYRLYQQQKESGVKVMANPSMNEERIRQLEDLGFVWAIRSGPDNAWRKRITELEEFRARHHHTAVPTLYHGNERLGQWAAEMRDGYRARQEGKPNGLEDEKIAELDTLGFSWDEPPPELSDATNNEASISMAHAAANNMVVEKPDVEEMVGMYADDENQPLGGVEQQVVTHNGMMHDGIEPVPMARQHGVEGMVHNQDPPQMVHHPAEPPGELIVDAMEPRGDLAVVDNSTEHVSTHVSQTDPMIQAAIEHAAI